MQKTRISVFSLAVMLSLPVSAQEAQPSKACIAADEKIYQQGVDGVKPPQLLPDKSKNAVDIRGAISLQLIVNSEGHVCSVKVLSARDQSSARKVADYIAEHWTFKPATRQGKPVAASITVNFGAYRE